jgi:LmbE family N-acetylglucosaminyl deacetylase
MGFSPGINVSSLLREGAMAFKLWGSTILCLKKGRFLKNYYIMKIAAVFAHPDDEAFAVSGTIKKLTSKGHEVIIVETTDGSAGQVHNEAKKRLKELRSIKKLRREELEKSLKIIGIKKAYYFDFKDGYLSNGDIFDNKLVDKIVEVFKTEKPDVVIAYDHTGISWHLDHIATSLATSKAVYLCKEFIDKLFLFTTPDVHMPKYLYVTPIKYTPTHSVDIRNVVSYKVKSIKSHLSQKSDWERFFLKPNNEAMEKENFLLAMDNKRNNEIFDIFLERSAVK